MNKSMSSSFIQYIKSMVTHLPGLLPALLMSMFFGFAYKNFDEVLAVSSAISAAMWLAFLGINAYMGWWIVLVVTSIIVGYCYFLTIK